MIIRPLALYIGLRYTRAKRRTRFVSFISLASMLGIALGVTALITVLSVMNGFDYQIREHFFALAPQVTAVTSGPVSNTWRDLAAKIEKIPDVITATPFVSGNGLFTLSGQITGVQAVGIDPQQEIKISQLKNAIVEGNLDTLQPGQFNLIIGRSLAHTLGVHVGDKINLFTPQMNITLAGSFPRFRQFTVSGIFHINDGFGFEGSVVYTNLVDAEKLFPAGFGTSGLHIKLQDVYQAPQVSNQINAILPPGYTVTNWMVQTGAFFQTLAMEKTMMTVILLLIVVVAVFNLVSSLVMIVNDKRADIAILRTLGASPATIMATFIIQGAVVGFIGVMLGLIGGLLLAANATQLTNELQHLFHVQFISAAVYFIDFLPSRIEMSDVVKVCVAAFGLSVLATIYPASLAFRTQPAEALRYE